MPDSTTHPHSAVDGSPRPAYTEHLPDETAATTIAFHRTRAFFTAHDIHRITHLVSGTRSPCPPPSGADAGAVHLGGHILR